MNPIPQTITFRRSARAAAALLGLVILAIGLVGCGPSPEEVADGDDPLAALRVSVPSTRYGGRFWRLQHRQAPSLYADAVAFCRAESEAARLGERPNCEPVLMADAFIQNADRELRGPQRKGRGYTGMLNGDAPEGDTSSTPPEGEKL